MSVSTVRSRSPSVIAAPRGSSAEVVSDCMWQAAQERNVDQYDKLAEFITLVTELVPELLDHKQTTQLILGLRARVSDCRY